MPPDIPMRIGCAACRPARTVRPEVDELPGEIVIAHGQATSQQLRGCACTTDRATLHAATHLRES